MPNSMDIYKGLQDANWNEQFLSSTSFTCICRDFRKFTFRIFYPNHIQNDNKLLLKNIFDQNDNKKVDRIISKLLRLSKYFTCSLIVIFSHNLFCACGTFLNLLLGKYNSSYSQVGNKILTCWCLFKWTHQDWWTNQVS